MPELLNCPACNAPSMVCMIDPETALEIDSCPDCFGVWFDGRELSRFFSSNALFTRILNEEQVAGRRHQPPPSGGTRSCPRCGQSMQLVKAAHVELDLCGSCSGIWFDQGEVTRLVEASREGLLGDPVVVHQVGLGLALQAMDGLQNRQRQGLEALFAVLGAA